MRSPRLSIEPVRHLEVYHRNKKHERRLSVSLANSQFQPEGLASTEDLKALIPSTEREVSCEKTLSEITDIQTPVSGQLRNGES